MKKTLFIVTSIFFIFIISSVSAISWSGGDISNISTFLQLEDTPSTYSGQAGLVATVNPGETALIFSAGGGGGGITNISQAGDVDVSGIADDDVLKWDDAVKQFIASNFNSILSFGSNYLFFSGDNEISFNDTKLNETGDLRYWNIDGDNATGTYNVDGIMNVTDYTGTNMNLTAGVIIQGRLSVGAAEFPRSCRNPGDACFNGNVVVNGTGAFFAQDKGTGLLVFDNAAAGGEQTVFYLNFSGELNSSTRIFCDELNQPFIPVNRVRTSISVLFSAEFGTDNIIMEVDSFVNDSCALMNLVSFGDDLSDLSSVSYVNSLSAIFSVYDNGAIFAKLGSPPDAVFRIDNLNATGEQNFFVNIVAGARNVVSSLIDGDANGNTDMTNFVSMMFSSQEVNDTVQINEVNEVDLTNYNRGEYIAKQYDIIGVGNNVSTFMIKGSSLFDTIFLLGQQEILSKGWYDNTTDIINITNDINDSEVNTPVFELNGSILYFGNEENFTELTISLQTLSSGSIEPIFSYCNSSNGYQDLEVLDLTNDFQTSGSMEFNNPSNRGKCNVDIDGAAFADTTPHTYIAIQRTAVNIFTTPVVSTISIFKDSSEIRIGNVPGQTAAQNAFTFWTKELAQPGEVNTQFPYIDSSGNTRVGAWFSETANETSSGNSNSYLIVPDNDLEDKLNMTELTNAVQRYRNYFGVTAPVDFDSTENRTSLFVLYALLGQQMFLTDQLGNGFLRVEGDADIILRNINTKMDVLGGPLHLRYTEFVIEGVELGENATIFSEDFETGTMDQFSNEFWIAVDSTDCPFHDGIGGSFCAENGGVTPLEIDVAHFSSDGFNLTNLTINVVADLDGPGVNDGLFQLYMDNNEGNNELLIEIDALDLTEVTLANITIPESMNNKTFLNISIEYTGLSVLNQINIDNIIINAFAIQDTTDNVSRSRSHLEFLDADGSCEQFAYDELGVSNLNITCDRINLIGNVTETSVTEIELNITDSLSVGNDITAGGNVTIGGWFNGLFNWTTLTDWLSFDGATLSFNETKLNDTIDDRSLWISDGENISYSLGNVGINTSNPVTTLNVVGSANITGPTSLVQLTIASTEDGGSFEFNTGTAGIGVDGMSYSANNDRFTYGQNSAFADQHRYLTGSGGEYLWVSGGNTEMILDGSGNLGIGTTTPLANLHLNISGRSYTPNSGTAQILQNSNGTSDSVQLELISGDDGSSAIVFGIESNPLHGRLLYNPDEDGSVNSAMRFIVNGVEAIRARNANVGIFDTTPDYRLEISGSNTNGYFGVTNSVDGDIFEIDSNGDVGIGTDDPTHKLNVDGTFNVTGQSVMVDTDWNDGFTNGGVSISGGDILAQQLFVFNISSVNVAELSINGSLLPEEGFPNTFDIGTPERTWRDVNLGGELHSNGTGDNYFLGNVGIGTGSPTELLHIGTGTIPSEIFDGADEEGMVLSPLGIDIVSLVIAGEERAQLFFHDRTATADEGLVRFRLRSSSFRLQVMDDEDNTVFSPFAIDTSTGFVGINTVAPATLLHVQDSDTTILTIEDTSANGIATLGLKNDADEWSLGIASDDNFQLINVGLGRTIIDIAEGADAGTLVVTGNEVVFNEDSTNLDFRIESNNNADMFFVDGGLDMVGIGTPNPTQELEVSGDIGMNTSLVHNGDTTTLINFFTSGMNLNAGANGGNRLRIDDSAITLNHLENNFDFIYKDIDGGDLIFADATTKRVGIGTAAPSVLLEVNGKVLFNRSGTGNNLRMIERASNANVDIFLEDFEGDSAQILLDRTTNNLKFLADGDIELASGVNLGIGTPSPATLLEVQGAIAKLRIADDDDPTNDYFEIHDNSPTQALIEKTNSDGVVLIDINPIPNTTSDASVRLFRSTNTSGLRGLTFHTGDGTSVTDARISVGGENSYFQVGGGNVGIGTASPATLLEVSSAAGINGVIQITGGEGSGAILNLYADDGDDAADKWSIKSVGSDNTLQFQNNAGAKLTIENGGDVGIGTASPSSLLDVNGNASFGTDVIIGADLTLSGIASMFTIDNGGIRARKVGSYSDSTNIALWDFNTTGSSSGYQIGRFRILDTDGWGGGEDDGSLLQLIHSGAISSGGLDQTTLDIVYTGTSSESTFHALAVRTAEKGTVNAFINHDGEAFFGGDMDVSGSVQFPGLATSGSDSSICINSTSGALSIESSCGKTPRLTDMETNTTQKILLNMKNTEGVYKYVLPNHNFDSDFTFKISNEDPEREYFDEIHLEMRCHVDYTMYVTGSYPLIYSQKNINILTKSDDIYMELSQGDDNLIMFMSPREKDAKGCDWVDYTLEFEGYYERI